jgi:hypothetical protein
MQRYDGTRIKSSYFLFLVNVMYAVLFPWSLITFSSMLCELDAKVVYLESGGS